MRTGYCKNFKRYKISQASDFHKSQIFFVNKCALLKVKFKKTLHFTIFEAINSIVQCFH